MEVTPLDFSPFHIYWTLRCTYEPCKMVFPKYQYFPRYGPYRFGPTFPFLSKLKKNEGKRPIFSKSLLMRVPSFVLVLHRMVGKQKKKNSIFMSYVLYKYGPPNTLIFQIFVTFEGKYLEFANILDNLVLIL